MGVLTSIVPCYGQATRHNLSQAESSGEPVPPEEAFIKGAPIPSWVDSISPIPSATHKNPLLLRLSEVYFYVDQEISTFNHRAIQANEPTVLDQIGHIEINFQADYQRVLLHVLRVYRGNQVLDKLHGADVRFLRREPELDAGIYGGLVTASIVIDDLRVGDTLEIAYTTIGKNPVFGNYFFDSATWDSPYLTAKRRITLNAPVGRNIQYRVIGDGQQSVPEPKIHQTSGRRIVRFEGSDIPVAEYETGTPNDYHALQWIQFSEFASWQDVTKWAQSLFTTSTPVNSLHDALASARNAKSPRDAVSKTLEYVQSNIRYLSVSIGENSHRPYPPEQVLARRYGDCKDKSLLLTVMLRQLGIDATPVLVSTYHRKNLDRTLPSPQLFNHVIVRASVQGKVYFIDPTRHGQTGNLDRMGQVHANSQALVIAPDVDKVVDIPQVDEDLLTNTRTERVVVKKMDEPVQMLVHLSYRGIDAEEVRNGVSRLSFAQLKKFYEGNIAKRYPNALLTGDPRIEDDRIENHLTVELLFQIRDFFQTAQNQWAFQYKAENMVGLFNLPSSTNRKAPLAVPSVPSIYRYRLEVELPDEFDAHYSPSTRNLYDSVFSLSETLAFSGRQISVTLQMKLTADRVDPQNVADFMGNLNKSAEVLQGTLSIRHSDLKTPGPMVNAALPLKDRIIETLEKRVMSTEQVIADAKLTGQDASRARCERARSLAYLGRNSNARAELQSLVRRKPNPPEILRCVAEVALLNGDFQLSEQEFTQALALDQANSDVYLQRGIVRFYSGKRGQAIDDFSKAMDQTKNAAEKARARIWRVIALRRSGKTSESDIGTNITNEWPDIALAALSHRETPEAMLRSVHMESGDQLEFALVEAYFYLGQRYLIKGDRIQARAYFQQALDKGLLYSQFHSAARLELAQLK